MEYTISNHTIKINTINTQFSQCKIIRAYYEIQNIICLI